MNSTTRLTKFAFHWVHLLFGFLQTAWEIIYTGYKAMSTKQLPWGICQHQLETMTDHAIIGKFIVQKSVDWLQCHNVCTCMLLCIWGKEPSFLIGNASITSYTYSLFSSTQERNLLISGNWTITSYSWKVSWMSEHCHCSVHVFFTLYCHLICAR